MNGAVPMRVLYVIEALGEGGTEMSLAELLPGLRDAGVDPVVVCLKSRGDEGVEHSLVRRGFDVRVLEPGGMFAQVRQLQKIIRAERPGLVHTMLWRANQVGRLATLRRVPLVTSLVNESYGAVRRADPHVRTGGLRLAQTIDIATSHLLTTGFHAVSQSVKDAEVRDLRLPRSRVTVVRRGRDEGRLGAPTSDRRTAARRAYGVSDAQPVLVNVGRQEYQKGHRRVLAAFPGVLAAYPTTVLLSAGRTGNETPALEQLVAELGVSAAVRFVGHVSAVGDFLMAGDVFVFPSLYEGMPGAVLEAMAIGLPIVASDIPSVREVVEPGKNALLVDPNDHRGLADAIGRLLGDAELRHVFGARSREIYETSFRLDRSVRGMLDLYRKLYKPFRRTGLG
jgi:glycosyltransferase involved in cell wall biosynthesis